MPMRILFLLLMFGARTVWAIDIYANGHKYDSIHAYQESKKIHSLPQTTLNKEEQDQLVQEAKRLGVKVDVAKMKTFQIAEGRNTHRLYVLSMENGFADALKNFYQNQGFPSDFKGTNEVSSQDLQSIIQQEVTSSKNPKLLIAQSGKLRIMSLEGDRDFFSGRGK